MPVCAAWIGLKPCFVKEVGFMMRLPAVAVAATLMNDFSQNTETTNTDSFWTLAHGGGKDSDDS